MVSNKGTIIAHKTAVGRSQDLSEYARAGGEGSSSGEQIQRETLHRNRRS